MGQRGRSKLHDARSFTKIRLLNTPAGQPSPPWSAVPYGTIGKVYHSGPLQTGVRGEACHVTCTNTSLLGAATLTAHDRGLFRWQRVILRGPAPFLYFHAATDTATNIKYSILLPSVSYAVHCTCSMYMQYTYVTYPHCKSRFIDSSSELVMRSLQKSERCPGLSLIDS